MNQKASSKIGIYLMIAATLVFAVQDGISRHLAQNYNVFMVVMIRYWFFAALVIVVTQRQPGGLRRAVATTQPFLQVFRGVLLALEICVSVWAFTLLGLVETHAIFVIYPLLIAALSGPMLGETVGWRRWSAIGVGFLGMLVVLRPGIGVFSINALVPLLGAFMFALYGLLTRLAARKDSASTSFFWTGTMGAVTMSLIGVWFWEPMHGLDQAWMGLLSLTGVLGHWLLIKCYEMAEASEVQPFAFLQLVFVSIIGVFVFGEALRLNVAIGALVVVSAGLFTIWRSRQKQPPLAPDQVL